MSIWYVIPSKRPPEQCLPTLRKWVDMGYRVMVQRDLDDRLIIADGILNAQREYHGYGDAINTLVKLAMEHDPQAEWFVTGGDDVLPDPNKDAETIARECSDHFTCAPEFPGPCAKCRTFGVMQPTGDRWGECADAHEFRSTDGVICLTCRRGKDCDQHLKGAYIDRVAGSPWMGREFCRRINGGNGPYWTEYYHMFEDQELQCVAEKYGMFWQRRDLIHHHDHWGRPKDGAKYGDANNMPEFLAHANSPENWKRSREIFERRRAAGFPGSEPIG